MKRLTTNEYETKETSDDDALKILSTLHSFLERKAFWEKSIRKLNDCVINAILRETTKDKFIECCEKLIETLPEDNIVDKIEKLSTFLNQFKTTYEMYIVKDSLIDKKIDEFNNLLQFHSEDQTIFNKRIEESIHLLNSLSDELKEKQNQSENEVFDENTILTNEIRMKISLELKFIINEIEVNGMKINWLKESIKPLIVVYGEKVELFNDEQKKLIEKLKELI